MVDYGVTSTGFVKKPLDVIKTEIEEVLRSKFGETVNLLPTSVFGQIVGIASDREADIWDILEDVYASQYPLGAEGQSLDSICSITGVRRLQATKSTVTLSCNLNAGVTLPIGRVVSQGEGSDVRFATIAEVTNSGGSPDDIDVEAESEETGPIAATSGTLTHIETPVTGWNSATNALDADPGRDIESHAALRARREQQLRITGKAALDSIIAEVGDVDGVAAVTGFENDTDAADGNGMPPHSIEILVSGGDDQDIIDAIWRAKGGGIQAHGTESGTAVDSIGGTHTVKFSRPDEIDIYVDVEIETDDDYPSDGDDQIKVAVAAKGDGLGVDGDVVASALYGSVHGVSGVVEITKLWISTTNPPTGDATVTITSRQVAVFDTSRITVTSS